MKGGTPFDECAHSVVPGQAQSRLSLRKVNDKIVICK